MTGSAGGTPSVRVNPYMTKISRALVSAYDKTGIGELARALHQRGVTILSTGGTAKTIEEAGVPVTQIADVTLLSEIYDLYQKTAEDDGWTSTSENRGYCIRVNVADSDEKAYEEGKNFFWQLGTSFGVTPPHWQAPPGYMTRQATSGARQQQRDAERNQQFDAAQREITPGGTAANYAEAHATYQVVTGNPDTVIKKLKHAIDLIDPGYLVLWGREGNMSHEVAMRSIDLMTQEVIPAVKEYRADREKGKAAVASG